MTKKIDPLKAALDKLIAESEGKIIKFEPKGPLSSDELKGLKKDLFKKGPMTPKPYGAADYFGEELRATLRGERLPSVNPLISDADENPLPKDQLKKGPDGRWYDPKQYKWDKKLNKFIFLDPDRFMDAKNLGNKTLGELVGSKPSVVGGTKKTIWGSLLNKAIPFGKYTSRFFGGIPMLAGELDYNKPFPFMPDYEYKPVGGEQ